METEVSLAFCPTLILVKSFSFTFPASCSSGENQQGQRVYVTEVVCENFQLLESRSASEQRGTGGGSFNNNENGYQSQNRSFGNNNAGSGFNNNNNSFNPSSSQSQNNNGMPDFDKDSDPFGGSGSSIDISDDDLPF